MNTLKDGHRVIYDFLLNKKMKNNITDRFPMLQGSYLIQTNKKDYHHSQVQDEEQVFRHLKNHTALKKYIQKQQQLENNQHKFIENHEKNQEENLDKDKKRPLKSFSFCGKKRNKGLKLSIKVTIGKRQQLSIDKPSIEQDISQEQSSNKKGRSLSSDTIIPQKINDNKTSQNAEQISNQNYFLHNKKGYQQFKSIIMRKSFFRQFQKPSQKEETQKLMKQKKSSLRSPIKMKSKQFNIRKAFRLHSFEDLQQKKCLSWKFNVRKKNQSQIYISTSQDSRITNETKKNDNSHHFLFQQDKRNDKINGIYGKINDTCGKLMIKRWQSCLARQRSSNLSKKNNLKHTFRRKSIIQKTYI